MIEEKKTLLAEQIEKINEVIAVLGKDFSHEAEEEICFMNIVCNNLKELAAK